MYAVVESVDIEVARGDEAEKLLHDVVIPARRSQAGFVRGVWMRSSDKSRGRGVMLFDTEESATAAVAEQGPPPGAPVTVRSVEMFEVLGEA